MFLNDYGKYIVLWITGEPDYAINKDRCLKEFPLESFDEVTLSKYMADPKEHYYISCKEHGVTILNSHMRTKDFRDAHRIFEKVKKDLQKICS